LDNFLVGILLTVNVFNHRALGALARMMTTPEAKEFQTEVLDR
jgi:hypothetical protein